MSPPQRRSRKSPASRTPPAASPPAPAGLEAGIALLRQGRAAEAQAAFERILRGHPDHPGAWFNLGNAMVGLGRLDEAARAFANAVRCRPGDVRARGNLGAALCKLGRFAEAEAACREALALEPDNAGVRANLGAILQQLGRFEAAAEECRAAVRLAPDSASAQCNLGGVLQKLGRYREALSPCREAVRLGGGEAFTHGTLAAALYPLGQCEEAVAEGREAVRLKPDYVEAWSNLGAALGGLGRFGEAEEVCRRALRLRPGYAEAWSNLGATLEQLGRFEEAEAACREAVRLRPDHAGAHTNLGSALQRQGRFEESIAACREAVRLRPGHIEAQSNLGAALGRVGRDEEAMSACRAALRLDPDHASAHLNLGLLHLTRGEMAPGWAEYEWRWRTRLGSEGWRDFAPSERDRPQWRGEAGEGRTLLVWAEQGFGDTLQFCRFVPLAAARGWRVVLEVPPPLARLLGSLPGAAEIVATGEPVPAFDCHCPMLSLPHALGTTLATLPAATPYLSVEPARVAAWRARLAAQCGPALRGGLAWAGNPRRNSPVASAVDRRRSVAPDLLAPLMAVPGVRFVSLQKDGPPAPASFGLIDVMDQMTDFADTAALVSALDLVVSVDTSVVHLAGALGKKVWMLDRFDHCWRWLGTRRDSPWYPDLHIYRQPTPGDWSAPIAELARDMKEASPSFS